MKACVTVTYFLEMTSVWCHWAEQAWTQLKSRYGGEVEFGWKIALMDASGMPTSREQCEWIYRRSRWMVRATEPLSAAWFEPGMKECLAPNLVVEAARDLGVGDDRVRRAITRAALVEGRRVGHLEVSARVASAASGLDYDLLLTHAGSDDVRKRVRETTEEFHQLGVHQRPAFLIENDIGDRAVFSGIHVAEPLEATIDAMLADSAANAEWVVFPGNPSV
jgi:predicted DsbA family dithiol-disulfide isomerase